MDQKAIETKAVNAVRDIIVDSDYLDQFIADNDKEPSFDGFVYAYSKPGKKKNDLIGRIPVQIKGTAQMKKTSDAPYINSSVLTSDLKNYMNDGGVMYFVVHMSADGRNKAIFYESLLPIKLMKLLKQAGEQSSITLKFKPFPHDVPLMRGIFNSFLEHKIKQFILNDLNEIPKLEDLQKSGQLDQITFTTAGSQRYNNHFDAILNDEVYIYATLKGSTAHHPIDVLDDKMERVVSYEMEVSVSVNDIHFYDRYTLIRGIDNFTLKFGQSVALTFPYHKRADQGGKARINYTPTDSLATRTTDFKFLIEMVKSGCIYVNGEPLTISLDDIPPIDKWEDELDFWNKMMQMLSILNITEDISIKSISDREYREIDTLIRAFVDKEPFINLRKDLPFNYSIIVCGLRIALVHAKLDENESGSRIVDYFSEELIFGFKLGEVEDEKDHFIPVYGTLDKDAWATISNINFDDVVPFFERVYAQHVDDYLFQVANESLLSILMAYDETQKEKLLQVAICLSAWLLEKCPDETLWKVIRIINNLQAIKRSRELNETERRQLLEIAEDSTADAEVRAGACLLLDNYDSAEFHLDKLEASVRADFVERPICLFLRR